MWTFLSRNQSVGPVLVRAGLGCLLLYAYGWEKLAGGSSKWAHYGTAIGHLGIHFWHSFWGFLATMAETLGMALFIVGFAFRPACLYITFHYCVAAAARYHGEFSGEFGKGSGLEGAAYPLILAIVFLAMTFIGPGKYSIDRE